ncbi:hypothetical protein HOP51_09765 [Halomonas sp. MCCC 1A11036]|uniref:Uncharacterized protein n=1 Tax=Billgrantia zhangzhouensis TaxID=2733481 RepID=A0ABS9AF82_9GAMM|nr:hypothetical protein [Halomonas zhangzhouensis]MCE8020389.1 hypothetical protein [Halomonas zhangzhouensis]
MAIFKLKEKKENNEAASSVGGSGGGGIDIAKLEQVFETAAEKSMAVSKAKTEGNTEIDTARAARPNN